VNTRSKMQTHLKSVAAKLSRLGKERNNGYQG
jgi:hypothetical protein